MAVAVTVWEGRVSPVFDVAREVLVEQAGPSGEVRRSRHQLPQGPLEERWLLLRSLGVETLLCGAISRCAREDGLAAGLVIRPFLSGEVDAVLAAWREGRLAEPVYRMPGCGCGRGRRCRRGRCFDE